MPTNNRGIGQGLGQMLGDTPNGGWYNVMGKDNPAWQNPPSNWMAQLQDLYKTYGPDTNLNTPDITNDQINLRQARARQFNLNQLMNTLHQGQVLRTMQMPKGGGLWM